MNKFYHLLGRILSPHCPESDKVFMGKILVSTVTIWAILIGLILLTQLLLRGVGK